MKLKYSFEENEVIQFRKFQKLFCLVIIICKVIPVAGTFPALLHIDLLQEVLPSN